MVVLLSFKLCCRTLGENLSELPGLKDGQDIIMPVSKPIKETGHLQVYWSLVIYFTRGIVVLWQVRGHSLDRFWCVSIVMVHLSGLISILLQAPFRTLLFTPSVP